MTDETGGKPPSMRERMARAIFAVMHPADDPDERWTAIRDGVRVPMGPAPWERCLPEADAALSALAEPTDEMWEAGYRSDYLPDSTWRAMIRKAKEG